MSYVLAEAIVIPAGTELRRADDIVPEGGWEIMQDRGCIRVFIGEAAGIREGMIAPARPKLGLVK